MDILAELEKLEANINAQKSGRTPLTPQPVQKVATPLAQPSRLSNQAVRPTPARLDSANVKKTPVVPVQQLTPQAQKKKAQMTYHQPAAAAKAIKEDCAHKAYEEEQKAHDAIQYLIASNQLSEPANDSKFKKLFGKLDKNEITKGLIMSEILNKPKALRK